jgi:hypothetical protein
MPVLQLEVLVHGCLMETCRTQVERMRGSEAAPGAAEADTLEQQLRKELVSQRGVISRLRQEAAAAAEAAEAAEAQAAAAERDWQVLPWMLTECTS